MTITHTPEQETLVNKQVDSGLYASPCEVIREALQLFREQELLRNYRLDELRKEIAVGIEQADRGELAPLIIDDIKTAGRQSLSRHLVHK